MWSAVREMRDRPAETALGLVWVAYTLGYFVFYILFESADAIAEASLKGYLEVLILAVPSVVLLGAVIWLRDSDVDRNLGPPVIAWTIGVGILFTLAMYTAVLIIETRFDTGEQWMLFLLSAGFGMSSGSIMGVLRSRSLQRERERERSIARARRTERERRQLEYLNQYLRHEVLNETQKIQGYTSLLREHLNGDGRSADWIETIDESSHEIADFIQSIRSILEASDHDPDLDPVDLVPIIEKKAEQLDRDHRSVDVEIDAPEPAYALAGDLVGRVFSNLFYNALDHNDGEIRIRIAIERDEQWVVVRVRDDGSGIPPDERRTLFEPPESGDHGYGLFLINNLVELYGGRLELVDTGSGGTEFAVYFTATEPPEQYTPEPMPTHPTRSA